MTANAPQCGYFNISCFFSGAAQLASVAPVFEKIAQLRGERPFFTPYAIAVLRSNGRFSNAKATAMLGYHARPLRETLQSMILWFQGQNLISPAL